MTNELTHNWQSQRRRLRGTLTLGSTKPKPEDAANDTDKPRPAA